MKLLLIDGINNISAITAFNRKYNIDESFLLLVSILKSNQLELDYIDFANDRVEHLQIPKDELYSFVIINTNRNNIHIVKDVANKFNAENVIYVSFDMDFSSIFFKDNRFYVYFGNNDSNGLDNLFSLLKFPGNYELCECANFSLVSNLYNRNISLNTHTGFDNNGVKIEKNILLISSEIEDILKMGVMSFHINDLLINHDRNYIVNFCAFISHLKEKYDFVYSCEINFPIKYDIDELLKLLHDSGLQKIVIPVNSVDYKDIVVESVRKFIEYGIVNIQIEITQVFKFINQKDIYEDFIMELIDCSNGLTDIMFKNDELSTNIESLLDSNSFNNMIEYDNWIIEINKKIQLQQKKLYHRILLEHRHRIALLAKYGIISQLYISTIHKSNTMLYTYNRFIYFSYKIEDALQDYNPIISTGIYFDNLNNTHIFTDADFYVDKKELVYDEKFYKFFILLLNRLSIKEILKKLDKNEAETFMNMIKELEYNNCLYFVKNLM
jgi:hypothetical protein